MKKTTSEPKIWWKTILKIILIVVSTLASSQLATTEPIVDLAVKNIIVQTSNVLLTVLSSDSKDTAIIITDKAETEQIRPQTTK